LVGKPEDPEKTTVLSLISFCFRWFRFISLISFRFVDFVSFRFVSFRFVFVDFVSYTIILINYNPSCMSVRYSTPHLHYPQLNSSRVCWPTNFQKFKCHICICVCVCVSIYAL
jgi:hypothetical protein